MDLLAPAEQLGDGVRQTVFKVAGGGGMVPATNLHDAKDRALLEPEGQEIVIVVLLRQMKHQKRLLPFFKVFGSSRCSIGKAGSFLLRANGQ